jgi:dTMP kinase
MRGKFITVEGIEGVGKSTNIEFLSSIIEAKGFSVLLTREPGGTPMAERIREMLLEQHINNTIVPALEAGDWVVCDRFTDASRAYQGYGRGLGVEKINLMADWVHGDLQPDLTLLLDAPAEVGKDRAEKEEAAFYQRVRDGYLSLAKAEPERFAVIDASQELAQVQAQIGREMDRLFSDSQD